MKERELLTRTECTAMRGIAILGIMLHNYCHFVKGVAKESEYQFLEGRNDYFWQMLSHPDEWLPLHLLSYFGHYGVPVFLFLSGFGLVKKYEKTPPDLPEGEEGLPGSPSIRHSPPLEGLGEVCRFLRYNYLKLLRLLVVGLVLFLMVDAVTPARFTYRWDNVIAQLLMYINVLPEPDKIIWPGIYWFFGLMMELYIVYRLLLYRKSSWWVVALIVVCWLLQALCDPDGDTLNRLRYNFIGGMLPFGLGVLAARTASEHISLHTPHSSLLAFLILLLSICMVFAMCLSFQSWLWIPVLIIVGTVAMVKVMPEVVLKVFVWFGSISAAMFVAHPIARKFFYPAAWRGDPYDGLILYVLVAIGLSWAVKQIVERIPKPNL